ncbi:hypothetical protein BZM26_28845 [Paraburkholderia strydomiana]|nr:hypothetical protein BZM26_28845 [Paraburkholderia strydomiana]
MRLNSFRLMLLYAGGAWTLALTPTRRRAASTLHTAFAGSVHDLFDRRLDGHCGRTFLIVGIRTAAKLI